MSVQCNTYVMIGAMFSYDELKAKFSSDKDDDEDSFYERFDPYTDNAFKGISGKDGITVLFDGMNGDYIAIGKVLAKSENHQGLQKPVIIESVDPDLSADLRRKISDLTKQTVVEIRPLVISHYR